jgi:anaerobic C4-dicarboxylate transporter
MCCFILSVVTAAAVLQAAGDGLAGKYCGQITSRPKNYHTGANSNHFSLYSLNAHISVFIMPIAAEVAIKSSERH